MLRQLLVGGAECAQHHDPRARDDHDSECGARQAAKDRRHASLDLIAVMVPTVTILMIAHALEVIVWSWAYLIFHAAPEVADPVYFAFVNYTTLGYGDVLPLERWRLLGPITAMNGVLLFGWSTAVIFEVLRRTLASRP